MADIQVGDIVDVLEFLDNPTHAWAAEAVRKLLADRDARAFEAERLAAEADERQTVIKKLAGERDAARARVAGLEAERKPHVDSEGGTWVQITPGVDEWHLLVRGAVGYALAEIEGFCPAPVRITPPDERNPTSGLIGLLATQHADLSARAKDIARGREAL